MMKRKVPPARLADWMRISDMSAEDKARLRQLAKPLIKAAEEEERQYHAALRADGRDA